jgi:lysophospholipase L1-like esterase
MRIVLMGDSITFGSNASGKGMSWAERLDDYLEASFEGKYEIINSAVEGETAPEGLERIEDGVIKYTPDIVFVGYGTNDCTKEAGKYTNDYYTFESNMEDIAEAIRSQTNAMAVFNLAPPVNEELCNDDVIAIHNRDIEAYNTVVKRICGSMMLPFIDHYHAFMGNGDYTGLIDADGIHPNNEGHRVMFETIKSSAGHLFL